MPTPRKVQGRIAPAKVSEEAAAIVGLLTADSDAAVSRGSELVQSFSLTPRMSVVKELGVRMRQLPAPHPVPAVLAFLATQRTGLKPAQEPEFAAGILELALWCRGANATLAEELFYERITGGGPGDAILLAPEAIPAALASDPRFVTSAARAINLAAQREKLTAETMRRWSDLVDPLIRPDQDGGAPLQDSSAGELLSALTSLPPDLIPAGMLATVIRLVSLVPSSVADEFYRTGLGNRLLRWLRVPSTPAPPPMAQEPVAKTEPPAGLHVYKEKVRSRFSQLLEEVFAEAAPAVDSVRPQETPPPAPVEPEDRTKEIAALTASLGVVERERDEARTEVAAVMSERVELTRRLAESTTELTAVREDSERWKAEVKRRESELGGQHRVEQQQETQRASRLISPPLREVCEHLTHLLTADRRNEPLRRLAVSFDSLQKNLGRVLGSADIQRLPQELLARPEEGQAADENKN